MATKTMWMTRWGKVIVNHWQIAEHVFFQVKGYIFFHFFHWIKSFGYIINVQFAPQKWLREGRSRYKPTNHVCSISFNNHLLSKFNVYWQNGIPACTDFNLHMTMTPPPICYETNIYDFIHAFTRPIITKLGRMVDQQAPTITLHTIMTLPLVGRRTNIYGFISTFTKTMIIKLRRIVDQHALTLQCLWQWGHHWYVTWQVLSSLRWAL